MFYPVECLTGKIIISLVERNIAGTLATRTRIVGVNMSGQKYFFVMHMFIRF